MKILTREQIDIKHKDPIWIIGPSSEVAKDRNKIINNLQDKTVLAIGHAFPEMVLNWGFTPSFFTWYDPHQTHRLISNYDLVISKLSKKSIAVFPDFSINRFLFPASSQWTVEDTKSWEAYESLIEKLGHSCVYHDSINSLILKSFYSHFAHIGWKPVLDKKSNSSKYKKDRELSNKLYNDPDFRFNSFESMVIGTLYTKKLENLLTLYVLPLVQYLGFKTVFVLGFDGRKERFYKSSKRLNNYAKQFIGIEKWVKWEDFHKMEIINIQSSGPLTTKLKTVSFEDSLSYCNENI